MAVLIYNTSRASIMMDTGDNHKTEVKREERVVQNYLCAQRVQCQHSESSMPRLICLVQYSTCKEIPHLDKILFCKIFPSGKSQIPLQPYLNIHLITDKITSKNRPLMALLTTQHSQDKRLSSFFFPSYLIPSSQM